MGQRQMGPTVFMSEVPVLSVKPGVPPCRADRVQEQAHQRTVLLGTIREVFATEGDADVVIAGHDQRLDLIRRHIDGHAKAQMHLDGVQQAII